MSSDPQKKCFVIMPYGPKKDAVGCDVDFDRVYAEVIQVAVRSMGLEPVRCDEIMRAGSIYQDMFRHIAADDFAIVDISRLDANVFYELGVRHALRPSVTILIRRKGIVIPFNIQTERVIEYSDDPSDQQAAIAQIRAFIATGQNSVQPDSPIFNVLQDARKDWKVERIAVLKEFAYRMRARPSQEIHVITGDIREHRGIDVWVNSENTNMQMSRFYDKSLSAIIRYEGAEKDDNEEVTVDTIADELMALMKKAGRQAVTPGTVWVTGSGTLRRTRGVKRIFHAATVYGVPGSGYQAMQTVEVCVTNALRKMDDDRYREEDLRSIVFPMMGTGAGGGAVDVIAKRLVDTAISYLAAHPESRVEKIYFSAWNHRDLEACRVALTNSKDVEALT